MTLTIKLLGKDCWQGHLVVERGHWRYYAITAEGGHRQVGTPGCCGAGTVGPARRSVPVEHAPGGTPPASAAVSPTPDHCLVLWGPAC